MQIQQDPKTQNPKLYLERKHINDTVPLREPGSALYPVRAMKRVKQNQYSYTWHEHKKPEMAEGNSKDYPWNPPKEPNK